MEIWVFLIIYLPISLFIYNPFMALYLIAIMLFSLTKVVNFLILNFNFDEHEIN